MIFIVGMLSLPTTTGKDCDFIYVGMYDFYLPMTYLLPYNKFNRFAPSINYLYVRFWNWNHVSVLPDIQLPNIEGMSCK